MMGPGWNQDCAYVALALLMIGAALATYVFGAWLFRRWRTARLITQADDVGVGCLQPGTVSTMDAEAVYVLDAGGARRISSTSAASSEPAD